MGTKILRLEGMWWIWLICSTFDFISCAANRLRISVGSTDPILRILLLLVGSFGVGISYSFVRSFVDFVRFGFVVPLRVSLTLWDVSPGSFVIKFELPVWLRTNFSSTAPPNSHADASYNINGPRRLRKKYTARARKSDSQDYRHSHIP